MNNEQPVFIFVDESGDLGKHGSKAFTIAFLSTESPIHIERIIKRTRQRKLKRKMKEIPELKANSSGEQIRTHVLGELGKCQYCEINYITIDKQKVLPHLYQVKNKLYNYICGILINELGSIPRKIDMLVDKKDSNKLIREDFNQYIQNKIKERKINCVITIKHLPSYFHKGLQAVDFIAWAIN